MRLHPYLCLNVLQEVFLLTKLRIDIQLSLRRTLVRHNSLPQQ